MMKAHTFIFFVILSQSIVSKDAEAGTVGDPVLAISDPSVCFDRTAVLMPVVALASLPLPSVYLPFVAVPKDSWASIKVEREIQEYEVEASSFEEAIAKCRELGKGGWSGFTEWALQWTYNMSPSRMNNDVRGDENHVRVHSFTVEITSLQVVQTVHLPKLVPAKGFPSGDRTKWRKWLEQLKEHEEGHQRISSVKAIGDWFERRVANLKNVEATFPADQQLGPEDYDNMIRSALSEIWKHACIRITEKNKEYDQLTNHRVMDIDWKEFLEGYF